MPKGKKKSIKTNDAKEFWIEIHFSKNCNLRTKIWNTMNYNLQNHNLLSIYVFVTFWLIIVFTFSVSKFVTHPEFGVFLHQEKSFSVPSLQLPIPLSFLVSLLYSHCNIFRSISTSREKFFSALFTITYTPVFLGVLTLFSLQHFYYCG